MSEQIISVIVVDDHDVVRRGLTLLLDEYPDINVVGSATSGEEGVALAAQLDPDVVLMDLSMPGMNGVAATRAIVEDRPESSVVILTTFAERDGVLDSLDAGAVGYLMKDASPDLLHEAIRAAATGGSPIDPRVARVLLDSRRGTAGDQAGERLTNKQTEVLRLVTAGLPNRLVARKLDISEKTVKAHLTQIYSALGVSDRVQAALWAQRNLPATDRH